MAFALKRLAAWRGALVFIVLVLSALFAYYYLFVEQQAGYLVNRNLRMLDTLGARLEEAITGNTDTLHSFLSLEGFRSNYRKVAREASVVAPTLSLLEKVDEDALLPSPEPSIAPGIPALYLYHRGTSTTWMQIRERPAIPRVSSGSASARSAPITPTQFRLDLDRLLAPIFKDEIQKDVFDSVLVASTRGEVLFQHGLPELQITRLDELVRADRAQANSDGSGQAFTSGFSSVTDTTIGGTKYKLFLLPCCRTIRASQQDQKGVGWVLMGLTPRRKLSYRSFALSSALLMPVSAVLLFAVFSWPFLKLAFAGPTERVRSADAALAGICVLMATAVATMAVLDVHAYGVLKRTLDDQLEAFSRQLRENFQAETTAAYRQLEALERWATSNPDIDEWVRTDKGRRDGGVPDGVRAHYPFFETFALIDRTGGQVLKWSSGQFVTPLIQVRDREYVQRWSSSGSEREGYFVQSVRSWASGRRQAVVSKPAFDPRFEVAALGFPMTSLINPAVVPGFGFAVLDERGEVLFHSDPQHKLQERFFEETDRNRRLRSAVAARRAVTLTLRYWGQHYRAHVAPLALDQAAQRQSTDLRRVSVQSRDVGAGVFPPFVPWSVVTFYDQQHVRTVNVEWLAITTLFLVLYMSVFLATLLGVLLVRPRYVAPWIWPSADRVPVYQRLAGAFALSALSLVLAIALLKDIHLLLTAWLVPPLAWMAAYLALTHDMPGRTNRRGIVMAAMAAGSIALLMTLGSHDEAGRATIIVVPAALGALLALVRRDRVRTDTTSGWSEVARSYRLAAIMLLVVTAVLPTTAFFKLAHGIQLETFIKYGQVHLARLLQARERETHLLSGPATVPAEVTAVVKQLRELGNYGSVFFNSTRFEINEKASNCVSDRAAAGHTDQELPEFLEALLPYYSESSVGMRELVHDRSSGDGGWDWHRPAAKLTLHMASAATANPFCIESSLPSTFDPSSGDSLPPASMEPLGAHDGSHRTPVEEALSVILMFGAVAGVVFWTIAFVTRRLVLVDLGTPLWLHPAPDWTPAAPRSPSRRGLWTRPFRWPVLSPGQRRVAVLSRILEDEVRYPCLERIWKNLQPPEGWDARADDHLDVDEVVAEVANLAAPHYQGLWDGCTPDEKVVLQHLAEDGMVNEKSRSVVRRLMSRGLVRRTPHLTLMTETFRYFVLSQECRNEVREAERSAPVSAWDRMRWPLLAVLTVAVVFFFVTQQQAFNQTVGIITGSAGALPLIIHVIGLAMNKRSSPADVT